MTDEEIARLAAGGGGLTDDQIAAMGEQAQQPEPGFFDRAVASVKRGVGAVSTVGSDLVRDPFGTLRDPSKRRELERGIDDVVTLGYGQRLAARVGNALGDVERGTSLNETRRFSGSPTTGDTSTPSAVEAQDAANAPDYRVAGNVAGSFLPNPIAKVGGALAGRVFRGVPTPSIPSATAMGIAKGLGAYEATAPVSAALSADASGHRLDAARAAATDPLGVVASAAGGAVAGGGSHAVKNSQGGKARQFIEKRGGRVGVTTPGSGAPFDEMAVKGTSDAAIGEQAQLSAENVRKGLDDYRQRVASDPYNEAVSAITPEKSSQLVDVQDVYSKMVEGYYHPGTSPEVAAKLKHQLDIIDARYRHKDGSVLMTEDHLNGLRKTLAEMGQVGESTKAKLSPLQEAYVEAKRLVDQGPYAEANARYAAGTRDADESLRLMDIKRSHKPEPPTADINKIRLKGNRRGQNTVTAGADKPKVDRFVEKHPDLALELDKPELLRKKGDLSFSLLPEHGGLTDRLKHAAIAAAGGGAFASGHGKLGLIGAGAMLAYQNKVPIAGRLLYPLAERADPAALGARAGTLVPRLNLPQALLRIRQQEETRP